MAKKILIVEPDRELAGIMKSYLEKTNSDARVMVANTAQDAIIKADTSPPDVVVVELAIPEHNGIAFLHEFRSYSDWRKVPVVVYSFLPRDNDGILEALKSLDVHTYLYKPQKKLADLKTAIDEAG